MVVTQENVAVNGSRRLSPQEIADTLRERIRTGDLKAGDRLPTQAELAEEFGVERGTVRQALRALQEDGLLSNVSKGSPPRIAEVPVSQGARSPRWWPWLPASRRRSPARTCASTPRVSPRRP